jgi:molecular chaperone Hsp33
MAPAASRLAAPRDGDRLLGFTLPGRSARGRIVRLDSALGEILAAHAYPEPIARLLAEALALTALLGALFRPDDGQLTLQAKGEGGPVRLLVADYREGALRGYASQDFDRRFPQAGDTGATSLEAQFGRGHLVITLDQTGSADRYQGIVPLGGESLEAAAQGYFENSEQLPTLVRLAAVRSGDGRWTAGGLLLQHMARAEEGASRLHVEGSGSANPDWEHVNALAGTVTPDELADPALPLEDLLWRLFNEDEVRVLPAQALSRGCRCSPDHIRRVLGQFPEAERAEMRNAQGIISVDCEFCSRQFLLEV